jgi:hypothetical protein
MMIAFGISSLFFAILGVFIPFFGIFISGLSGFLSWMSAGKATPLGAAAVIINLVNLFFLSPGYLVVTSIDAHMRTAEQSKLVMIWMFVLFIQISAIGVFLINFALSHIDFKRIFTTITGKRKKKEFSNRLEQQNLEEDKQIQSNYIYNEEQTAESGNVTPISKALIYRIHGGRKQDGKFRKSAYEHEWRDLSDISFDGSRPHSNSLNLNRRFLKAYSLVITSILVVFIVVYLRPDLFPFLTYSSVYSAISKTFPEKYLDFLQKKQQEAKLSINKKEIESQPKPIIPKNKIQSLQRNSINNLTDRNNIVSDYWYIIELKDGEIILSQDAVITSEFVSILIRNGEERRIAKEDLKSFTRKKI